MLLRKFNCGQRRSVLYQILHRHTPCHMGGLNIPNSTNVQYLGSRKISAQLGSMIELQSGDFHLIDSQPAELDIC